MPDRQAAGRAFVISPIGAEGSPERQHADDVFEFIIEPALKEAGIEAYRGDHTAKLGRITQQMVSSIMDETFCIAVLTGHNPNVFFELAIAQCAARPVILLIQKGERIPFDIHDLRVISYDLSPRALRDGVYTKQIVEQIDSFKHDHPRHVPFAPELSPLGAQATQVRAHASLDTYVREVGWSALIDRSNVYLDMIGLSLTPVTKSDGVREKILEASKRGAKIRVLLCDLENPWLPLLAEKSRAEAARERFRTSIADAHKYFAGLQKTSRLQLRLVRQGAILQHQVANEHEAVVTPLLYDNLTTNAPTFVAAAGTSIYKTWQHEFEALWQQNLPVSA